MDEERPHAETAGDARRLFFRRRETWLAAAGLLLLFLPLLLPVELVEQADPKLDPAKVRIGIGIFLCIAFLWVTEALPLAATALLVPVLAALTGVMEMKAAMSGFADPLIFLFFGGFALASAMAAQGLDRWIADRIVHAGRGDFLRVSYLIFAVTAGASMWMSNTATTALMIPLVLGILGQICTKEDTSRNSVYLLLGTAYAASIGGLGTLVGTPPNGIAARELGIGFTEWLKFGIPSVLLLLPLMVVVLRLIFRPLKVPFALPERTDFRWSAARITTVLIFALVGLGWIFSGPLAAALKIANSMDTVIALLGVVALVLCRVVGWREIERGTEWGVLLLFGGGIALSNVLEAPGATLFKEPEIVDLVRAWPPLLLSGAALLCVLLLGECSSNTASAALMVPIFYSIAKELDLPPAKLVIPLALAASCGFMLPVATPPNAIVFATGRIPQRQMLKSGAVLDLVCLVTLALLAWWVF